MRIGRTLIGVLSGVLAATILMTSLPTEEALARRRRGGALRLVDIDVGALGGVELNTIIEMRFTQRINVATANHATIQIRAQNATGTGFTRQVPGDFQVQGRFVRFFPRLPTHLRDPDDPEGGFYPKGHARDDANDNAGFQPGVDHEILVVGHPAPSSVRSRKGRRLNRTFTDRFTTSELVPEQFAYTVETYQDNPPPAFQLSNPADKVANVLDQYAQNGGTKDVPNAVAVTLFGNKVPISPTTLRQGTNISMRLTQRMGDLSVAKPVQGAPFLEQNFDTTRIVYQPNNALPDLATYALRVRRDVKDLTKRFDFTSNAERLRLRTMYEFLVAARNASPGTPPEALQDPPSDVIFDWPRDAAARGILKRNLLDLGDTYPDEVDPRVMVLFSTRDEPVTRDDVKIDFLGADGFFDPDRSTGTYDETVDSAAAAILTIAAGSGQDGDYLPTSSEVVMAELFPDHEINWRRVDIPPGVIVTITGDRPAKVNALLINVDGELRADGAQGEKASSSNFNTPTKGGRGGPGGGTGGESATDYPADTSGTKGIGGTGEPGVDENGTPAAPGVGGQGGLGGKVGTGTILNLGGGGGGGGARTGGTAGARAGWAGQASWNGVGGAGGAGSSNDGLDPLVGGAGGGSGGNYARSQRTSWSGRAGAGGGGGGALRVSTATLFTVGTTGLIRSRGGRGGDQGNMSSSTAGFGGPGGGGGGGSLLLRSTAGFNFADPGNATDVLGGSGGTGSGTGGTPSGGVGGEGYVRLEDPNGAFELPGGSAGVFNPVGGGLPSVVYTKWIDIGVDAPRILNFTEDLFEMNATNDGILIEIQMCIEDPDNFGQPKIDAQTEDTRTSGTGTTNVDEVSAWLPLRIEDNTRAPNGGAFPDVVAQIFPPPGGDTFDHVFNIEAELNGKTYRFFRYRITFQLDPTQGTQDAVPFVDAVTMEFEFNF